MKKLLTACAVAGLSAAVFGDVTSANVVGYQSLAKNASGETAGYDYNAFNVKASTFLNVGAGKAKLGDISLVDSEYGGTALQLLSGSAATLKITPELVGQDAFDEFGAKTSAVFDYLSPAEAEDIGGVEAGWYLEVDADLLFPMNNVEFKLAQGFLIKPQENISIQFAGEVNPGEDGEIAVPYNYNEFNVVANATPSPLTLGDVTLSDSEYGGTALQFLSGSAATLKITPELVGQDAFDEFGAKTSAVFDYLSPAEAEDIGGVEAGWYLEVDGDLLFPMNGVKLLAGQGFLIKPQEHIGIAIPSAL